jgi:hypothetical protein
MVRYNLHFLYLTPVRYNYHFLYLTILGRCVNEAGTRTNSSQLESRLWTPLRLQAHQPRLRHANQKNSRACVHIVAGLFAVQWRPRWSAFSPLIPVLLPWSPWYGKIRIDEAKGKRWFCTEAEALAAGWRPVAVY